MGINNMKEIEKKIKEYNPNTKLTEGIKTMHSIDKVQYHEI